MSLNWNLSEIEDYEATCFVGEGEDRTLSALTHSFILQSMVTGLGKDWTLDADYAPEFYARIKIIERMSGPIVLNGDGTPYHVTPEDVRKHIGLATNCSPVTRAKFIKNVVTYDLDAAKRQYEREAAKVAA